MGPAFWPVLGPAFGPVDGPAFGPEFVGGGDFFFPTTVAHEEADAFGTCSSGGQDCTGGWELVEKADYLPYKWALLKALTLRVRLRYPILLTDRIRQLLHLG